MSIAKLPYSLKILLENLLRREDGRVVQAADVEKLARWIAKEAFGAPEDTANQAALAARLAKADLMTDMVREFPELQGTMGGIYAREEGLPEEVP